MKKIKIIDLLNKIANGEEVPHKVKYNGIIFTYFELYKEPLRYIDKKAPDEFFEKLIFSVNSLTDEVEIIEEPQPTEEEIKEYTNKFLEVWELISKQFGKLFDELIRIRNDLGLNLEDFIKEEPKEHKIPEKFKVHSLGDKDKYGNYVNSPFPTNKELMNKINEIIDYLEKIE